MYTETLDLDSLVPKAVVITFDGNNYPCSVPTVEQSIELERSMSEVLKMTDSQKAFDRLIDSLRPCFPAIDEIKNKINNYQLFRLHEFVQKTIYPKQSLVDAEKESQAAPDAEKKTE